MKETYSNMMAGRRMDRYKVSRQHFDLASNIIMTMAAPSSAKEYSLAPSRTVTKTLTPAYVH